MFLISQLQYVMQEDATYVNTVCSVLFTVFHIFTTDVHTVRICTDRGLFLPLHRYI